MCSRDSGGGDGWLHAPAAWPFERGLASSPCSPRPAHAPRKAGRGPTACRSSVSRQTAPPRARKACGAAGAAGGGARWQTRSSLAASGAGEPAHLDSDLRSDLLRCLILLGNVVIFVNVVRHISQAARCPCGVGDDHTGMVFQPLISEIWSKSLSFIHKHLSQKKHIQSAGEREQRASVRVLPEATECGLLLRCSRGSGYGPDRREAHDPWRSRFPSASSRGVRSAHRHLLAGRRRSCWATARAPRPGPQRPHRRRPPGERKTSSSACAVQQQQQRRRRQQQQQGARRRDSVSAVAARRLVDRWWVPRQSRACC